jgi:hypothetical protein
MTTAPRAPLWRAVQIVAGIALFLYALRLIAPLPLDTTPFALLAALLAAGAMAVTDSVVGLLAALFDKLLKGRRA